MRTAKLPRYKRKLLRKRIVLVRISDGRKKNTINESKTCTTRKEKHVATGHKYGEQFKLGNTVLRYVQHKHDYCGQSLTYLHTCRTSSLFIRFKLLAGTAHRISPCDTGRQREFASYSSNAHALCTLRRPTLCTTRAEPAL